VIAPEIAKYRELARAGELPQLTDGEVSTSPGKLLFFDIENRPLSYWYKDRPTAEVTAIGWKQPGGDEEVEVALMRKNTLGAQSLLKRFLPDYNEADIVIGHNIRSHDLPLLNAICIEYSLPAIKPKLTIDTYRDLIGYKDIPKSLDYLTEVLECPIPKHGMSQHKWRKANRLEAAGLIETRKRVVDDVLATEWVYQELIRLDRINKDPKVWSP
jgi:hypothetical protein